MTTERGVPGTSGAPQLPAVSDAATGADTEVRLPFLDGIRAAAVVVVLLYHAGVPAMGGGLLGVDVFFVLSGFLITSLLCAEHRSTGRIRLRRFWIRRARRLLPALFIVLLGVAAYARVFSSSVDVSTIRGDALATLLYVANWHFIATSQGYFAQSATVSPLLHTWSLGVEEQYYLIWPLVALFVLRRGGRRALAWVSGVGALASALLMASMYQAGVSTTRLYYGTDTRAQALLVGSLLGTLAADRGWRVVGEASVARRRNRTLVTGAGLVGVAGLVTAWTTLGGQDPLLYRGGFLAVALATAAVITAASSIPRGALARVLSLRPLTFVGRISYGLYLYHWPLFLALDHAHTGLDGVSLLSVRLGATFAVAVVSWRLVEEPIRRRRFLTSWRAGVAGAVAVAITVITVVAATVPAVAVVPKATGRVAFAVAELRALQARHAFSSNPERFVLLGDSQALTLRFGLQVDSVHRYGVRLYPGAWLGCDLDPSLPVIAQDVVYSSSPGCLHWPTKWVRFVTEYRATVVGILLGRFELLDHLYDGTWMHVGDPVWDRHLTEELDLAIRLVSSHGAKVALFTAPYDKPVEAANGSVYPENEPGRVNAYNRLLRAVAAAHPHLVTLVDLNRLLDPDGHYTLTIDGIRVRYYDGVHITIAGGEWLQPRLLPEIDRLALQSAAGRS